MNKNKIKYKTEEKQTTSTRTEEIDNNYINELLEIKKEITYLPNGEILERYVTDTDSDDIFYNKETKKLFDFHKLLAKKLYTEKIQSCNSKKELNYFIKPKDVMIGLHDKFLRYGNKSATPFIIIDIDNVKIDFDAYVDRVNKILNGYTPNWILKSDKGYHIAYILDKPVFLNNINDTKKLKEIKNMLTKLLTADSSGSLRTIGYWRNPLKHKSIYNIQEHSLNDVYDTIKDIFETDIFKTNYSIKYEKNKNNTNYKNDFNNNIKRDWSNIDKTGFIIGNRVSSYK